MPFIDTANLQLAIYHLTSSNWIPQSFLRSISCLLLLGTLFLGTSYHFMGKLCCLYSTSHWHWFCFDYCHSCALFVINKKISQRSWCESKICGSTASPDRFVWYNDISR